MKNFLTLIIATTLSVGLKSQITCVDSSLIDSSVVCLTIYDPVCGCDSVTYSNDCIAQNWGGVISWTAGPCSPNPSSTVFCDDFESYQAGDYLAQNSPNWETWASIMAPCPTTPCADDAMISSSQASTGANSLYLTDASGSGGPQDMLLPFGAGIPYTTGDLEVSLDLFVTTSAYLNIQAEPYVGSANGGIWALNITIDNAGGIVIDGGSTGTVYLTSTFPLNQWAQFKLNINLTQNIWEVFIDNQSIGSFSNSTNKASSMNLYPTVGNDFYADNVCFEYIPFIPLSYDMSAIDLSTPSNLALPDAPFTVSGEIVNLGSNTITSADINYSVNGGAAIVDNVTGLNLALFDTLSFNHSISWTPPSTGVYVIEIWASNLNNGNVDLDQNNDIYSDTIYVWNNIATRRPLIETFTSSTCPPCAPANITAEALFVQNPGNHTSIKYQVDFPGSGDPYYTDEVGERMDYYMPPGTASVPRMQIDGGWDQNGNNITQQVLDDYIEVVSFVNLSATYSINIKNIEVDVVIDPLEDILSNNLLLHVAIIEETTYNNVKTNGETQFEHVVKKMVPDAGGTQLSNLLAATQQTQALQYEFQGNYRLPNNGNDPINHTTEHSVENFSNLMVAVWIQDDITKEIHQSTMAELTSLIPQSFNCDNNVCVDPLDGTGTYASLANCESVCNSTSIEEHANLEYIHPNPATETIYISELKSNATVKIYDLRGKLVLEKEVQNKQEINISFLSRGIYQVTLDTNNWSEKRKLIIE